MISTGMQDNNIESEVWQKFKIAADINETQLHQFVRYLALLSDFNTKFNITAITQEQDIIATHFLDSLALSNNYSLNVHTIMADVGAGGGFPGVPLKIKYPAISLLLIEVNQKKQQFLAHVVKQLSLTNVTIIGDDWRQFLRRAMHRVTLFCARASLQQEELVRIFKPSSAYKDATLVYWASQHCVVADQARQFFDHEVVYYNGHKKRRLIFFACKQQQAIVH